MTREVSVILSTHNPHRGRLKRTLQAVLAQSLAPGRWELVVVDNASTEPVDITELDLRFGENVTLVREERLGLKFGRLKGIATATAAVLVFIDDDTVMAPDYLEKAVAIFARLPHLGLGGGKCIPEWESGVPPDWVAESYANLALRDLGQEERVATCSIPPSYPSCAPVGAGMVARRDAVQLWIASAGVEGAPTGRRGTELTSGEDCDMVMSALNIGWRVGYFPELALTHLIPSARVTPKYLGRLNHGIAKSWVEVLARHGIFPWRPAARWSVPLRKARAYLRHRAWAGPGQHVRWKGACGQFDGRAAIAGLAEPHSARRNGGSLTLGRLVYLGWYRPIAFIAKCWREGPINLWLAGRGRRAMETAVASLPPFAAAPSSAPAVYFLTGRAFWYQTAFCAHTLLRRAERPLRIVIIDDGTLGAAHVAEFQRIFAGVRIVWADEVERKLDIHLPANRFPSLRRRRLVYPHLRKLTDVHASETGWKLVLDSDMLFHHHPRFILDWLGAPDRPCHMTDVEDAYGYSIEFMTELAGAPIPRRVNVGLCGLKSDAIDWPRLEAWCRAMLEREGSHYLQEQALVAMIMAREPHSVAPAEEYKVRPSRAETIHPSAALHHYVAESKAWYFRFGWRWALHDQPRAYHGSA